MPTGTPQVAPDVYTEVYPQLAVDLELRSSPSHVGIGQAIVLDLKIIPHEEVGVIRVDYRIPAGMVPISDTTLKFPQILPETSRHVTTELLAMKRGLWTVSAELTSAAGFHHTSYATVQIGLGDSVAIEPNSPSQMRGPRGLVTVEGNWTYQNEYWKYIPIKKAVVELWDNDSSGTDDLLAQGHTNETGHFKFTVNNVDADDSGTVDAYVVIRSESEATAIRYDFPDNHTYSNRSTVAVNVADGTYQMGDLSVEYSWAGPYHLLETVIDGHDWLNESGNWSRPFVPIYWPYETWPHSHGDSVHLPADWNLWEWQDRVILHEYGHTVLYAARDNTRIPGSGGSHTIHSEINGGLALSEGWANSYMCMVYNDKDSCWQDWQYQVGDIENSTAAEYEDWGDWDGNIIEGCVAAVFWDIYDGIWINDFFTWASPYGDGVDHEFAKLWDILLNKDPNHLDDVWINYTAKYGVNTDIWAVFYHYRANYDRTLPNNPTAYISPNPMGVWSNDNTIEVNLSLATDDVSGVWGFNYTWSNTLVDPSTGPWFWGTVLPSKTVTDGTWYLCVRTRDWAGNFSSSYYCNPDPWMIDTEVPTNPTSATQTVGTTTSGTWQGAINDPAFTWTGAKDKLSGLWGYFVYFGNNSMGTSDLNTTLAELDPPAVQSGVYFLRVIAVDQAGNKAAAWVTLYNFLLDITPPKNPSTCTQSKGVTESDLWQNSINDAAFIWAPSIDVHSGLQGYRYYWGPNPDGTSLNITIKALFDPEPVGDGVFYLRISTVDKVGNAANWTTLYIFKFDLTKPLNPTLMNQTVGSTTSDVWQNKVNDPNFEWSGHSDPASGIELFHIYWGPDPKGTASINTTAETFTDEPVTDGTYYLRIRAKDRAGNLADWATIYIFKYDGTAPAAPTVIGKDGYWNSGTVNITLISAPDTSGIKLYSYSIDGGAETFLAGSNLLQLTLLDGTHTLEVKAVDNAGNVGPMAAHTIKIDSVPPTGKISINNDANYTVMSSVNLSISASDTTSGVVDMRFSSDAKSWSAWEAYATEKLYELTGADGSHKVYVQFRDGSGLMSSPQLASIILDTTKPTGTVAINGGKGTTSSSSSTLTLTAKDANGVSEMRFSDDGVNWGPWLPFQESWKYSLKSGTGKRTVHVQFKDKAGQVSAPVTDSITVQTGMGGVMTYLIIGIIVLIVVVIVIAVLVSRRKKANPSMPPSQMPEPAPSAQALPLTEPPTDGSGAVPEANTPSTETMVQDQPPGEPPEKI